MQSVAQAQAMAARMAMPAVVASQRNEMVGGEEAEPRSVLGGRGLGADVRSGFDRPFLVGMGLLNCALLRYDGALLC
jgi:hypothetical protein